MRWTRAATALALLAGLVGCAEGDPMGPADSANSGGTGSNTLRVEGEVDVEEAPGGFLTELEIYVWDQDDAPVSGAVVTMEGGFGREVLGEQSGEPGYYRAELSRAAWGDVTLNVEASEGNVRNVVIGNIGLHAFVEPEVNDTVDADADLTVRWAHDARAPLADLSTRDFEWDEIPDTGEFMIPADMNPARSDQRLFLTRYNEVLITGALQGSVFRMEVEKSVGPFVVR